MKNVISQFLGLDLVNINVYAKVYQNIPLNLRDRAIFAFSEFGARQSLDRWKMSFCNLLGWTLLISMFTQNKKISNDQELIQSDPIKFIKIFYSISEIGLFSHFQNLALGKASTDDKCHFAIPWTRSCRYQYVCKILSKYSKRCRN